MEDEEAVRRLLAEARHDQPVPAEVVARLDRALAVEQADSEPARAVDLASRRRRRWGAGLVAAAAVVVAAVVGPQLGQHRSGEDSASSATSLADGSAEGDDGSSAGSSAGSAADGAAGGATGKRETPQATEADRLQAAYALRGAVAISSGSFDDDVAGLRDRPSPSRQSQAVFDCAAADWGDGELVPVIYDGAPAVLVFRPDQTTAELLQCGTGEVLRSTTLPRE
ncbi:hypothetical protein [Nocardioides sp.]|uniref:hypothetical protein n=1 Tax=Nocardioides sp. TaxID=35761 RepID=UPI0039E5026A